MANLTGYIGSEPEYDPATGMKGGYFYDEETNTYYDQFVSPLGEVRRGEAVSIEDVWRAWGVRPTMAMRTFTQQVRNDLVAVSPERLIVEKDYEVGEGAYRYYTWKLTTVPARAYAARR